MKCSVKIDEKLQKELNEKLWLNSLISLIVGAIGLGAYIVIGIFFESFWLEMLLWVCAFAFGIGLSMLIAVNKVNKKASQNNHVDEMEFFEDHFIGTTTKNGEVIATNKVYYKDLLKIRETENYIFLYMNTAAAAPVPKKEFSPEELSTIKLWVNSAKIKK
ncbi:MAG: YcxB family protein [Clostridia bacterium]|nr:YcxB family protein [Clostridia bacterium]